MANGITQGFAPAAFAPLGATYANFIDQQYGASPLAAAYASAFSPFAQLQYLSNPAMGSPAPFNATTVNPFGDFLSGGFTPLTSQGFITRAQDVANILGMQGDGLSGDQLRIQERFGTGEDAASRQRRLAEAPIMTNMPFALRGETQNILNRLYNRYLTSEDPNQASYLQQAMAGAPTSLWERFNVRPQAAGSAGEG